MSNFGRVLRQTLHYRVTFVASILCALGVAVLWGGNIGAVYPFVEIAFKGESLHAWVDHEIEKAETTRKEFAAQVARHEAELAGASPDRRGAIEGDLATARLRVEAEERALTLYRAARPLIYRYLPDDPFQTLALIVAALLVGTVLKDLCVIGNTVLVARLANLATFDLRKKFFRRTLRMDLATFNDEGSADLMSRFTHDTEHIAQGTMALYGKMVREPLKGLACMVGAALICWRLLVLSLVIAPLAGWLIHQLARRLKKTNRSAMERMAQIYGTLEETFRGIKVVKAFTLERQERRRFHVHAKRYYRQAMRTNYYDALAHPLTELMGIFTISVALLAGAWLVLGSRTDLFGIPMTDRPLSLGALLLFYGLLAGAADPARKLSDVLARIQKAVAAADRVFALLDRQPKVRDPEQPRPLDRHHAELVFDGVDFGYRPDHLVLHDVNLTVPFGETVAIVGANGCGKSTLMNLIARFADPTAGAIRIDGLPLTEVRLRDLRRQISLVTQETILFDDTVYNNIRFGRPGATRDEVIAAAKQAQAHRFIEEQLSEGYETVVGPMGCRLSGGQRQRIALARAILRDPAILLLDEATSQVDLESEQVIHKVLEQFIRGRTAVIITHRLSTLVLADRIVVMDQGRIVDVGTHQELSARCSIYRRMCQIEFHDLRQSA